jgi:predicted transcriptional regulator
MEKHPEKAGLRRISIVLDEATADRLENLSDACHDAPERVAAPLLHDILAADAEAHYLIDADPPSPSIN